MIPLEAEQILVLLSPVSDAQTWAPLSWGTALEAGGGSGRTEGRALGGVKSSQDIICLSGAGGVGYEAGGRGAGTCTLRWVIFFKVKTKGSISGWQVIFQLESGSNHLIRTILEFLHMYILYLPFTCPVWPVPAI